MIRTPRPRRLVASLGLPVVAAVSFAACGDDDSDSEGTDAPPESTVGGSDTTIGGSATTVGGPETTAADVATTAADVATTAADVATTGASETTSASDEGGVTFTSPQADFELVFPSEPSEQVQDAPLPDGSTVPVSFWIVEEGDRSLTAARAEFPPELELDPPTSLQGAQDQAIANVGGTLIEDSDIDLEGRPGRQFSADVASNGVEGTLLARLYLDGNVQYQVLAVGAGELTFEDEDLAAFFDSFQFTS